MVYLHLLVVAAVLSCVYSQSITQQTCNTNSGQATIQTSADAYIGGLVSMHGKGSNGYGCGSISPSGNSWSKQMTDLKFKYKSII